MPFQRQAWQAYLAGESGLIQVPTGSGKTYAAVMGPIAELLAEAGWSPGSPGTSPAGLRLLYLTPLRALSRDLALAIQAPIEAMGWPLRHHPRIPQPDAGQWQGARAVRRAAGGGARRVARADGQQARRAGRTLP
jgi:hypothetical protein